MSNSILVHTKSITLQPGLYLLHYISAIDTINPPSAHINISPSLTECHIAYLCSDPDNPNTLTQPNSGMAIRVSKENAEILINIFINTECTSPEAQLKLEKLFENNEITTTQKEKQNIFPLTFSGHVQWQGDIQLKAGEELGNPNKNWRIENFSIDWPNKITGITIEYSCVINNTGETPKSQLGNLVGTKSQALPITGITAKLVGEKTEPYELILQVTYSESGQRTIISTGELISGLHENEFLTGLKGYIKQKTISHNLI